MATQGPNAPEVILVSTGGHNPPHPGHLAMLKAAKASLEKKGYKVIQTFTSPSHDQYIAGKVAGMKIEAKVGNATQSFPRPHFSDEQRRRLFRRIIRENDPENVAIHKYESKKASGFIDNPQIMEYVVNEQKNLHPNAQCVYVGGEDLVEKMIPAWKGKWSKFPFNFVSISRGGNNGVSDPNQFKKEIDRYRNDLTENQKGKPVIVEQIMANLDPTNDMSSSGIMKGDIKQLELLPYAYLVELTNIINSKEVAATQAPKDVQALQKEKAAYKAYKQFFLDQAIKALDLKVNKTQESELKSKWSTLKSALQEEKAALTQNIPTPGMLKALANVVADTQKNTYQLEEAIVAALSQRKEMKKGEWSLIPGSKWEIGRSNFTGNLTLATHHLVSPGLQIELTPEGKINYFKKNVTLKPAGKLEFGYVPISKNAPEVSAFAQGLLDTLRVLPVKSVSTPKPVETKPAVAPKPVGSTIPITSATSSDPVKTLMKTPTIPQAIRELAQKGYNNHQKGNVKFGPNKVREADWIEQTFNKEEDELVESLKSLAAPSLYSVGEVAKAFGDKPAKKEIPTLTIVEGLSVSDLHKAPLGSDCIVQVASQFDFQESPGPYDMPVSSYIRDRTQGPFAAVEAAAAALHRKAAKHSGNLDHALKQLLPAELIKKYPTLYKEGYLELSVLKDDKVKKKLLDHIEKNIKQLTILPQWAICEASKNLQMQVFCAAPSFQGQYTPPKEGSLDDLICKKLVIAQYVATAQLAVIAARQTGKAMPLHLTLVGQGAFRNNPSVMKEMVEQVAKVVQGEKVDVYIHAFDNRAVNLIQDEMNKVKDKPFKTSLISKDEFNKMAHPGKAPVQASLPAIGAQKITPLFKNAQSVAASKPKMEEEPKIVLYRESSGQLAVKFPSAEVCKKFLEEIGGVQKFPQNDQYYKGKQYPIEHDASTLLFPAYNGQGDYEGPDLGVTFPNTDMRDKFTDLLKLKELPRREGGKTLKLGVTYFDQKPLFIKDRGLLTPGTAEKGIAIKLSDTKLKAEAPKSKFK